jgi:hypothetical protein
MASNERIGGRSDQEGMRSKCLGGGGGEEEEEEEENIFIIPVPPKIF